ncbi:hypothetical protein AB0V79_32330 [Mesorhizobium ciceri]|uniref:hypothetical protein n=1 Tax=Mesorhizobium TaxID=68287 RepID=UPI0007A95152|nr:hypothetical protein [Mesorhizobium ciceri]AMX98812.1 hypothetical protein A4R29_04270 [Mesorhizobium ciceri biovar biserrulae]
MTVGSTKGGAIAHAGQQNRYTFDLASPARLYFDSLTNDPYLFWTLIGPRGEEVNARSCSGSDAANLSGNPVLDLVAGSYTLVVDGALDATGTYKFRLLDLAAADPIILGDPFTGILASGNETALCRFAAAAGDQVLLNRQALSAGSPYWRLIDPFGGRFCGLICFGMSVPLGHHNWHTLPAFPTGRPESSLSKPQRELRGSHRGHG